MKERQAICQKRHNKLSKRRKSYLLGVNLPSCYVVKKAANAQTTILMNEIRDIYALRPFQGYRRMTDDLKDREYEVNHKRVYRLMKKMGLHAIYPKKNLSKRRMQDAVFPYMLKDHPPQKPHDCWCVDITYIKTAKGFIYLTALIDVVSRCVMGFHVSPFLGADSCLLALDMALKTGFKPKIINSDQGCQFTSQNWVWQLVKHRIEISMDGKGRALDNIPIERFWRTIKYEEVYLKTYETVSEAKIELTKYIHWYNNHRRHSGLNKARPYEVMTGEKHATFWSFNDGSNLLTTETILATKKDQRILTIKQQKELRKNMNHSLKFAA